MEIPVVVVIGAGASYASGRYDENARPPLTRRLFTGPVAAPLLESYLLAQSAGQLIERMMRDRSTLAFEEALRSLRLDGHGHRKQMSLALPLYLQALMLRYSKDLHASAERYSVLIEQLLTLREPVHFVSLNYDTLLDARLNAFSRLDSLSRYVDARRRWSLLKPHGSVNWFRKIDTLIDPRSPPEDLQIPTTPIRCVPVSSFDLRVVRGSETWEEEPTDRYPAIALPEGPKDELVLPPEHLLFLTRSLRQAQRIDVLILGYSALDTEILELIRTNSYRIRRLTVVNSEPKAAVEVYDRIRAAGIQPIWADTYDGTYEQWIDRDGLSRWVAEFDGPFSSRTDPEDLRKLIESRQALSRIKRKQRPNWLTERF